MTPEQEIEVIKQRIKISLKAGFPLDATYIQSLQKLLRQRTEESLGIFNKESMNPKLQKKLEFLVDEVEKCNAENNYETAEFIKSLIKKLQKTGLSKDLKSEMDKLGINTENDSEIKPKVFNIADWIKD